MLCVKFGNLLLQNPNGFVCNSIGVFEELFELDLGYMITFDPFLLEFAIYCVDDRLNSLTKGFQAVFGGSFDKYINDLQSDSLVKRDRQSPKKTFIIPNIVKIKALLQSKAMVGSFDNMNLMEQKLEPEIIRRAAKLAAREAMDAYETQRKPQAELTARSMQPLHLIIGDYTMHLKRTQHLRFQTKLYQNL